MKKLMQNKFLLITIICGVILFLVIAGILIAATATQKAAVLNSDAKAGTSITDSMVTEIQVPMNTPGDFYKSTGALVGERLTTNVSAGQLIYKSDLASNIEFGASENEEFVTASIKLDDEKAMGGLLTAGDKIDIGVTPKKGQESALMTAFPEFQFSASDGGFYYVLSNVTLLDTTTALSSQQGSNLTTATTSTTDSSSSSSSSNNSGSSYYLLTLSYNDYKKLRIAESFGDIWFNLVPSQNGEKAPLLDQMKGGIKGGLSDAAAEPIESENKKNTNSSNYSSSNNNNNSSSNNNNNSSYTSGSNDNDNNGDN